MRPPETKKPLAATSGSPKSVIAVQAFDGVQDIAAPHVRQVLRLRSQYKLTWPVARLIAELHFGRAVA
jgi:hypothetical protein